MTLGMRSVPRSTLLGKKLTPSSMLVVLNFYFMFLLAPTVQSGLRRGSGFILRLGVPLLNIGSPARDRDRHSWIYL